MFILKKIVLLIIAVFFLVSCSKQEKKIDLINQKQLDLQVLEAYEEGMKSLNSGDVIFAAKKFNEAEVLFPQSEWAPKSALMAAYSYYSQDYYDSAEAELLRFIKIYPSHKNLDYAHYLLAIIYYEQISDEKKDLQSISSAKKNFEYVLNQFPNTDFSIDAEFKLDLINDILASKEMFIGRYYTDKKKWVPAINRFKTVINNYERTIYIEEALYRLVEIHYLLGLKNEAQKYAKLLGYNYKSSEWYEKSYLLFNKNYVTNKVIKQKKKSGILDKIKFPFN